MEARPAPTAEDVNRAAIAASAAVFDLAVLFENRDQYGPLEAMGRYVEEVITLAGAHALHMLDIQEED